MSRLIFIVLFTCSTVALLLAQCSKDPQCITVKVNVIYDKNANDGKGLTDNQKDKFEKNQLQGAKNEYGDAKVHFDVHTLREQLTQAITR